MNYRSALGVAFLVALTASTTSAQEHDTSVSCTPPGAHLSAPIPVHFSAAQIEELQNSYSSPEVRGLRTAIDSYTAGSADTNTTRTLSNVEKSVLRKKFTLFSDERGVFGGFFLLVQFKGDRAAVYQFWVYHLGGSSAFDVRAADKAACSNEQQQWLHIRYKVL